MTKKPLQVMKFGGTSVGDAPCIARVAEIVRDASRECRVAVIVSAMSGVTNRLIEAANLSKKANGTAVAEIFATLKRRHDEVVTALIHSSEMREKLQDKLGILFAEGERLCQGALQSRELTPRTLDAISAIGERLCAPMVAAALIETGLRAEAIEATELVVTDSYHGGAEPRVDLTRIRCQSRLAAMLASDGVPVVTGFIGASTEGILTTLGRGGSDYSATILGAALDADEVVIWTDVPGLLTGDPRLVAGACTIREISYDEAAELAHFGAKVLHPKTLRPIAERGIPIEIRSTFAPDEPGTRITSRGRFSGDGVKAVAAIGDASLITVKTSRMRGVPDALARIVAAVVAARVDLLLSLQSSSHDDTFLVVPSADADRALEALRGELGQGSIEANVEPTVFVSPVSVVTIVGQNLQKVSETVARVFVALGRAGIHVMARMHGSSNCSVSFVVPPQTATQALAYIHHELALGGPKTKKRHAEAADLPGVWLRGSEQATAD